MQRKLTITVDESVYEALHRVVGRGRISGFIEELVRPRVIDDDIEQGFVDLARYEARTEAGNAALDWADDLITDVADDPR